MVIKHYRICADCDEPMLIYDFPDAPCVGHLCEHCGFYNDWTQDMKVNEISPGTYQIKLPVDHLRDIYLDLLELTNHRPGAKFLLRHLEDPIYKILEDRHDQG